jgi:hypothetical protein
MARIERESCDAATHDVMQPAQGSGCRAVSEAYGPARVRNCHPPYWRDLVDATTAHEIFAVQARRKKQNGIAGSSFH